MIADPPALSRGDGAHPEWPPPHARPEPDPGVEPLRKLASDTRKALDAAYARVEAVAETLRQTRADLAEAQEALHARDAEYAATIRALLDRLGKQESHLREGDEASRRAEAAETRCHALELRFEHVLMKFPRHLARKIRWRLLGR